MQEKTQSSLTIKTKVVLTKQELLILEEKIMEAFPDGITITTITKAVTDFMGIVGQIQELSGHDKKQLVIDMLSSRHSNDDQLNGIVENVVPFIIDSLIDVENGDMVFNQKVKKIFNCFVCLTK
jgi:hypothetical protein